MAAPQNVSAAVMNVARALKAPPPGGEALVRNWELYHRVNVAKAGATNFTFFNEAKALGITNLDNPSQIAANNVFVVRGLKFSFLPGFDRTGLRLGIAAPTQAELEVSALNISKYGTTAADPLAANVLWQEKVRELMYQGVVKFNVGDRTMHDQVGLVHFPEGRGVVSDSSQEVALTNSNTTTVNAWSILRTAAYNGAPFIQNVNRFPSPVAIYPGTTFGVTVDFPRAVDFTQQYVGPLYNIANAVTAGTLECRLFGDWISGLA